MAFGRERPDPRPFLRSIWRRRWLLAALIVGIPVLVFIGSSLLPEQYEATTTLQARTSVIEPTSGDENPFPPPNAQEAARLVDTTTVAIEAAKELGGPSEAAGELLEDVSAVPEGDAVNQSVQLLTITARADSAERAADLSDAFATGLTAVLVRQGIKSIDETIRLLRSGDPPDRRAAKRQLDRQIQDLEALRASRPSTMQVVERATVPASPSSPRPLRNTALAFVLSVLLAGALVPLLDRLDRNVHDPDELEELSGSRLLAAVPESAFGRFPPGSEREAFQTLRTSLMYFNVDRPITSLLIASPGAGDGKTTVAMNLAAAMARAQMDVVLVDADLRRLPIAARLDASGRHGLGSVLLEEVELDDAIESVDVEGASLRILSGGAPVADPPALLGSKRMRNLMSELESEADVVVVDTPPILPVSDAIPLLGEVSGVLLVGRLEHTTRDAFWRAARVIASAQGTVLGVVATGVPDDFGERYGAGQYPASQPEGTEAPAAAPARSSS